MADTEKDPKPKTEDNIDDDDDVFNLKFNKKIKEKLSFDTFVYDLTTDFIGVLPSLIAAPLFGLHHFGKWLLNDNGKICAANWRDIYPLDYHSEEQLFTILS